MFKHSLFLSLCLAGTASAQFAFDAAVGAAVGNQPEGVVIADLDGDGDLDVAATSDAPDKVSILFNGGAGVFGAPVVVLTGAGTSPHALQAADLDGDGDVDLAVTLKNVDQVRVLRNNGGGAFVSAGSTAVGSDPRDLRAADLDGDGDVDLVTANRGGDSFTVLLNGGAASFTAATTGLADQPRAVAIGRFDADADLDLAVSINDLRRIDLFLNNGSGAFAAGPTISTGAQLRPEGIVAADFDGDGDVDLAAAGSGGGLNVVMLFAHDGAGGFVGPSAFAAGGLDPSAIVAADFDVDGDLDLAVTNTDSNTVSVLANNGLAAFGAPTVLGVGTAPQAIAAGDLDGNGGPDLAVTNDGTGNVSILMNQAGSAFTDLGAALAGSNGTPVLVGSGTLAPSSTVSLTLSKLLANSPVTLVVGLTALNAPFKGGTMVPDVDVPLVLVTNALGGASLSGSWPAGIPSGTSIYLQAWQADAGGVLGYSASNAIVGVTP